MRKHRFSARALIRLCLAGCLIMLFLSPALAYEASTLYNGCSGEEVRQLQQALIDLGFLKGTADGIFGSKTEDAVRAFQKKSKLNSRRPGLEHRPVSWLSRQRGQSQKPFCHPGAADRLC